MKTQKACSFTGHRTIPQEHIAPLVDLLDRAIAYAYAEGCRTFFSGGAVGFDLLAARRVLLFRISHPDARLVMLLPCLGQEEKWSPVQRERYYQVLRDADEVEYLADAYDGNCMRRRNAALVSRADMLVAYVSRRSSGAGQTLHMAERKSIAIYNLYPSIVRAEGRMGNEE